MAAHSMAGRRQSVGADVIAALREGTPLADARLEALREFTRAAVRHRGWGEQAATQFLEAGFTKAQLLEVLLGVAQKTLSNYVNHLAHTPLAAAFAFEKWERPVSARPTTPAA